MCSTLRKPIVTFVPLRSPQTRMVFSCPFISDDVVWLCLTGNPAGVGVMGMVGIAHAALFVYFVYFGPLPDVVPLRFGVDVGEREWWSMRFSRSNSMKRVIESDAPFKQCLLIFSMLSCSPSLGSSVAIQQSVLHTL